MVLPLWLFWDVAGTGAVVFVAIVADGGGDGSRMNAISAGGEGTRVLKRCIRAMVAGSLVGVRSWGVRRRMSWWVGGGEGVHWFWDWDCRGR